MHAVARFAAQRLRGEVGGKTVAQGDGIYDCAERDRIVRGLDGLGIPEIDLILTGTLLVVGAFRRMPICSSVKQISRRTFSPLSSGAMSMYPARS